MLKIEMLQMYKNVDSVVKWGVMSKLCFEMKSFVKSSVKLGFMLS
jgi:hypothetical protein